MNAEPMNELAAMMGSDTHSHLTALLVIKDGYIVLERYGGGWDTAMRQPMYHATESVTSALAGIAIGEGKIEGIDTYLADLLPEYGALYAEDSLKQQIKLRHLLSMTGGLEWDQPFEVLESLQSDTTITAEYPDPLTYILSRPMAAPPGEDMSYNIGFPILVAKALQYATGTDAANYAGTRIFDIIGITDPSWTSFSNLPDCSMGLSLTPRDMARFGLLYARGGQWHNRQVIPADWVELSTRQHAIMFEDTLMTEGYGLGWWTFTPTSEGAVTGYPEHMFASMGGNGCIIFVIPAWDIVVVGCMNGTTEVKASNVLLRIIDEYIIGAVLSRPSANQAYIGRKNLEWPSQPS